MTPRSSRTSHRNNSHNNVPFCCRLFVCLFGFFTSSSRSRLYRGQSFWQFYVLPHLRQNWETMTLSRSHYTDTDTSSRERVATAGIEPRTSSPGVARSTNWATAPFFVAEPELGLRHSARRSGSSFSVTTSFCLAKFYFQRIKIMHGAIVGVGPTQRWTQQKKLHACTFCWNKISSLAARLNSCCVFVCVDLDLET